MAALKERPNSAPPIGDSSAPPAADEARGTAAMMGKGHRRRIGSGPMCRFHRASPTQATERARKEGVREIFETTQVGGPSVPWAGNGDAPHRNPHHRARLPTSARPHICCPASVVAIIAALMPASPEASMSRPSRAQRVVSAERPSTRIMPDCRVARGDVHVALQAWADWREKALHAPGELRASRLAPRRSTREAAEARRPEAESATRAGGPHPQAYSDCLRFKTS